MSVGGRRWSCRRTLGIHSLFHQPLFCSLQVAVQSYKHAGSSTQVNTETRQLEVMLTPEEYGKSMRIEWAAGWGGATWGSDIWERAGREPPQSEGTAASTAALGQQLEVPQIEVWLGVWHASMQMLMQLTDLCLYSPRCLHSLLHKFQMQCVELPVSSDSAPTIAPHCLPVPFHLLQPLLKMSLHLFLGDHPFKTVLKPCPSVKRHLPSVQEHLAHVALLLSMNWKATLFPIVPFFRHRWLLKRIWPRSPPKFLQEGQPGSSRNVHPLQNTHREGHAF